jgi:hypothetical protein
MGTSEKIFSRPVVGGRSLGGPPGSANEQSKYSRLSKPVPISLFELSSLYMHCISAIVRSLTRPAVLL